MSTCYLCMELHCGKDHIPVFLGYRLFSSQPWALSNTGGRNFYTILYQTDGDDYSEAQEQMFKSVEYLADLMPVSFWKEVWPWIDPSREADQNRFDLIEERRKKVRDDDE